MLGIVNGARAATAGAVDLVLPPSCLACDAPVGESGALCADCWSRVSFIGQPCCARCGLPFAIEAVPDALCGDCARLPPAYDRARAAFLYEGAGRELILAFKMADPLVGRTEARRVAAPGGGTASARSRPGGAGAAPPLAAVGAALQPGGGARQPHGAPGGCRGGAGPPGADPADAAADPALTVRAAAQRAGRLRRAALARASRGPGAISCWWMTC